MHTGDGELFDRNVETVTDNAEYRSGSVSAREVGWQTCPGVLFIGASLRIRIQVMTSFDRKATRGANKRRAWEAESQRLHCLHIACWILITTTVRAMTVLGTMKKKSTNHVKKKKHGELATAEWGKENKLLTA